MGQGRGLISGLLNGGGTGWTRWGWGGGPRSLREIWSAVRILGPVALFRRPVPLRERTRRRS
jgi:hypothetical protein